MGNMFCEMIIIKFCNALHDQLTNLTNLKFANSSPVCYCFNIIFLFICYVYVRYLGVYFFT